MNQSDDRIVTNNQTNLSYMDFNIARDGSVMTCGQIKEERIRLGYCTDCQGVPIRLYTIGKSKFNPLYAKKHVSNVVGESLNGECLACKPYLDPNYKKKKLPKKQRSRRKTIDMVTSTSTPTSNNQHSDLMTRNERRISLDNTHILSTPLDQNGDTRERPKIKKRGSTTNISSGLSTNISSSSFSDSYTNDGSSSRITGDAAASYNSSETKLDNISGYRIQDTRDNREEDMSNDRENSKTDYSVHIFDPRAGERQYYFSNPNRLRSTSESALSAGQPHQRDFEGEDTSNISLPRSTSNSALSVEQYHQRDFEGEGTSDITLSRRPLEMPQESKPTVSSAPYGEMVPEPDPVSPALDNDISLSEIDSLIKDVNGIGDTGLVVDILVRHMKENHDTATLQGYCLGKIWDLCKENDEYKNAFIYENTPKFILSTMEKYLNNTIIQEQACGVLWAFCTSKENRMIVIRSGATAGILRATIKHINVEDLVATALGCLRTISPEPESRESITAMSGREYVCKAMTIHCHAAGIQRDACNFLSNCAVDLQKQEVARITECEVEAIGDAMVNHGDDASVMTGACFALKNFSFEEQNVRYIRLIDGIVELLEKISQYCEDSRACRDSSIVLERMLQSKLYDESLEDQVLESISQIMVEDLRTEAHQKIHQVIDLMQEYDWSFKVLATVFHSLTSLYQQYPNNRGRISSDQVIGSVAAKMKKYTKNAMVQINGCKLLGVILRDNADRRRKILNMGGCEALVAAMSQHSSNAVVQIVATGILKTLSIEFDCWFQLQQSDFSVEKIMMAHSGNPQIQENGQEIMINLSLHQVAGGY